ncbi:hypothetical protein M153_4960002364 [Pseudoloma neurophilia]|uniref:Uncharacterized protein n=1 Tax=Pseudoloma neurophilia TaxID=146866 RepID=A0A0R0M4B9_9MICR|nr:hypothetical protein M153_4960002364 [Pseudoloma neurophilia]
MNFSTSIKIKFKALMKNLFEFYGVSIFFYLYMKNSSKIFRVIFGGFFKKKVFMCENPKEKPVNKFT